MDDLELSLVFFSIVALTHLFVALFVLHRTELYGLIC